MKALLYKDFKLSSKWFFLFYLLTVLALIPNWPTMVTQIYIMLMVFQIFSIFDTSRDLTFTQTLPVASKDIVKSKFVFSLILEFIGIAFCAVFAVISIYALPPLEVEQVFMAPNFAFFGITFVVYAIFNLVFFTMYFKRGKSPLAFLLGCLFGFLVYIIVEVVLGLVPSLFKLFATVDSANRLYQVLVSVAGLLIFTVLSLITLKISQKNFENSDI